MKFVFLSEIAKGTLCHEFFSDLGYDVIFISPDDRLYDSISTHPDIIITKFHDILVIEPNVIEKIFLQIHGDKELVSKFFIKGENTVGDKYPHNIGYNSVVSGNKFIHNLKYTDSVVLREVEKRNLDKINIKQGYSRCSMVSVDEETFITSDKGIFKTLLSFGIDALLIGEHGVKLKGKPYGFLGGASGTVENNIVFFGDLSKHPDFLEISEFIKKRGKNLIYFNDVPLEDIGSIITFNF